MLLSNSRTTDALAAAKSAEVHLHFEPRPAACALLSNSRTTDALAAAKSAEVHFRFEPRPAACALLVLAGTARSG